MKTVSMATAGICYFLGVIGLSIAFERQNFAVTPFSFRLVMIEVFPLAVVLCALPFLVARLITRTLGSPSLRRSMVVWFFTGAGGTAAFLLLFSLGNTRQNIEPSIWLLCLYLGIAGLGVGVAAYLIEVSVLKTCRAMKVDQNAA